MVLLVLGALGAVSMLLHGVALRLAPQDLVPGCCRRRVLFWEHAARPVLALSVAAALAGAVLVAVGPG